jgi:hypothetical protein
MAHSANRVSPYPEIRMTRLLLSVAALAAAAAAAHAHMADLVPAKDGQSVTVVFSDTRDADEKVKMDKLAGLKLFARTDGTRRAGPSRSPTRACSPGTPGPRGRWRN